MVESWKASREALCNKLMKDHGKDVIGLIKPKEVISSGSVGLDAMIGVGGIPCPSIVEIFGPESGGKTMMSLSLIANAQKKFERPCVIVDMECAFNEIWADTLGVDLEKDSKGKYKMLDVIYPPTGTGDEALDIVAKMVESNIYPVIVVDSVAALTPKEELEGNTEDAKNRMGLAGKMMSVGLRKINSAMMKSGSTTAVIFINQVRDKLGILYGDPESTPGGRALKFYCHLRMRVNKIGQQIVDPSGNLLGHKVKVTAKKNRFGAPGREAEFDLHYYKGIDKAGELYRLGIKHEIITRKENKYWHGETVIGSKDEVRSNLEKDPVLCEEIRQDLLAKIIEELHPRKTEYKETEKVDIKGEKDE